VTVHLVGAGPGDPELLTVRAATLLSRADVVVHDRLIDKRVLEMAAPWAELINAGKRPGSRANSQESINEILIERAHQFDCVVRLKGGDPFVFGRGGEEAIALRQAGVEVEEVPGVTSAIAAPAAAGIPVTMRGMASGVTIVTGHQENDATRPLDWEALGRSGTTLVILMGAASAERIAHQLLAAGMSPDTPVAVIRSATTNEQQVQRASLSDLAQLTIVHPSTIVVGQVAAHDVLSLDPLRPTMEVSQ